MRFLDTSWAVWICGFLIALDTPTSAATRMAARSASMQSFSFDCQSAFDGEAQLLLDQYLAHSQLNHLKIPMLGRDHGFRPPARKEAELHHQTRQLTEIVPKSCQKNEASLPSPKSKRVKLAQLDASCYSSGIPLAQDIWSSQIQDQSEGLCTNCRNINFDQVFGMPESFYDNPDGRAICSLNHIDISSNCGLCQFFQKMKIVEGVQNKSNVHTLFAFSARWTFNLNRHKVRDSVLLAVYPSSHWVRDIRFGWKQENRFIMKSCPGQSGLFGHHVPNRIDYVLIGRWLQFCTAHHSKLCRMDDFSPISGFRVMDCASRTLVS